MPLLPPVIATLFADTKEFMAKMDEAELKMGKFGAAADASGGKFNKFTQHASTAILGLGAALIAGGVDSALKFQDSLDAIRNQAGASAAEVDYLKGVILNISDQTAISSENISSAFLQVEKAGIRGKAAYNLVDAAAKAAAITGGDVTTMTQTLVGIQNLQIAKGMSVAQVTDLMVLANQRHVGSLDSLTSTLTGKTGGALAAAGLNLAEMASVADIAAKAGYNNARAYTQLATGLTKIESPTTASSKAMAKLGINADQMAAIARHPGTGLVDVLGYLEARSKATGISMNTLIKDTFGAGSVGLVTTLATHIKQLSDNVTILGKSSGNGLNTAFGMSKEQLGNQLTILKNQAKNILTGVGLFLLPAVQDLANWSENAIKYFKSHPIIKTIASDATIGLFAAALTLKVGQGLSKIPGLGQLLNKIPGFSNVFGGQPTSTQAEEQITWLQRIAALLEGEEAELGVLDVESGVSDFGVFAPIVATFLAAGAGLNWIFDALTSAHGKGKVTGAAGMPSQFTYLNTMGAVGTAITGAGGIAGPQTVTPSFTITLPQEQAIAAFFAAHRNIPEYEANGAFSPQLVNALTHFVQQDKKKNYSVVVNINA